MLYDRASTRQYNNYRTLAGFHGVKLPALNDIPKVRARKVAEMTEAEKKAETDRMIAQHMKAFGK